MFILCKMLFIRYTTNKIFILFNHRCNIILFKMKKFVQKQFIETEKYKTHIN